VLKLFNILGKALGAMALMLLLVFIAFISQIPWHNTEIPRDKQIDAIVVLTGGSGRIEEAMQLLQHIEAKHLFISGVSESFTFKDLAERADFAIYFQQKINLGRNGLTTYLNAIETRDFVTEHHLKSIILVTSNYHIPRTKLIFSAILPNIEIIYYPAISDEERTNGFVYKNYHLYLNEFKKYLGYLILYLTDSFSANEENIN
jgi:uncharacterized SAM-binding protein YcdF (DUF218 family)